MQHLSQRRLGAAVAIVFLLNRPAVAFAADDVQVRPVPAFDRIHLSGAYRTDVVAGVPRARVTLGGDPSTLTHITTEVRERTLYVDIRDAGIVTHVPTLTIALPVLRAFASDGAGSVALHRLTGGDLDIENSGAVTIVADGRAAHENITLNGAGKIDAADVHAGDVDVENNGVGLVDVRAAGHLVMNVNGLGVIRYAGSPTTVDSHVNGLGHIGRR